MNRFLTTLWLTVVWVMLWGSPSAANIAGGVAVASFVTLAFPVGNDRNRPIRPVAVARLGAWFLAALVIATVNVAAQTVRPRLRLEQRLVTVQLRATSELVVAFVANSISLTPGTLTVGVEPDDTDAELGDRTRTLLVHSLNASDAESVRSDCAHIEELVVAAFGTADDRTRIEASPYSPNQEATR